MPAPPSPTEIRAALQRVTLSDAFRNTPQLVSFLTFVVERSLAGEAQEIKGYTIATQALGRPAHFDPQSDPIVRVEAGRLRRALDLYYAGAGQPDPVRIRVPRGSYVPRFERAEAAQPTALPDERAGALEGGPIPTPPDPVEEDQPASMAKVGQTATRFLANQGRLGAAAIILLGIVLAALFAAGAGLIAVSLRQEGAASATATLIETQPIVAVGTVDRLGAPAISPEALRSTLLDVLARFDEIAVVDLAAGPHIDKRLLALNPNDPNLCPNSGPAMFGRGAVAKVSN
jgi:hypothetical protein